MSIHARPQAQSPGAARRIREQLLSTVRRTVDAYELLPEGVRVLAACSGGGDSVTLVHLLARLAADRRWEVYVGHVHHGLRSSADGDAAFVAELAGRLGLPCLTRRLRGLGGPNGEARSRAARYAALAEMAREAGAQAVATGHTLDDQAETVLLRLLRGTGVAGLSGILPRRPLAAGVDLVRPLLWCRRQQLRQFLTEEGEAWREDETNADLRHARNRVRARWMPLLSTENPRLAEALAQLAEVVREEESVWAEQVARIVHQLACPAQGGWTVTLREFCRLPVALQRRVLRELVGNLRAPRFVQLEQARRLVCSEQPGQELAFGGGVRLQVGSDSFWVGVPSQPPEYEPVPLPVPGRCLVAELGVLVEARVEPLEARGGGWWEAELDVRWVQRELVVRTRKPGDRIRLAVGTRKLQDLLVDLRVPRWERDRVPLVASRDGEVVWVVGRRVADAARPAPEASHCLRLRAWPLEAGPTSGRPDVDGILGEQPPAGCG